MDFLKIFQQTLNNWKQNLFTAFQPQAPKPYIPPAPTFSSPIKGISYTPPKPTKPTIKGIYNIPPAPTQPKITPAPVSQPAISRPKITLAPNFSPPVSPTSARLTPQAQRIVTQRSNAFIQSPPVQNITGLVKGYTSMPEDRISPPKTPGEELGRTGAIYQEASLTSGAPPVMAVGVLAGIPKMLKPILKGAKVAKELKPITKEAGMIKKTLPEIKQVAKELQPLAEEARGIPKIEIKKTNLLFQNGVDAGKPSGDITYDVIVDGNIKGKILNSAPDRFQVMSDSILGEYKAKYFKTLKGAQDFIINSKEKYIPLDQIDLMTGQRKVPPSSPLEGAKVATQNKSVRGAQDAVGKAPSEPKVIKRSPVLETTRKADIQPKVSSNQSYIEIPKVSNAIEKTATQMKEPPSTVRRVVNSLSEVKTKVIEYVQNEQERVRKLVNRKDVKVDDISDPYLKATLYPGRVAEKINQGKQEVEAIVKDSKKVADDFKSDLATVRKEVNDYLYFRHAPERNAALGEKAAGITTKEAEAGLKALESSPRGAKIKELANRASKLNEQTLDLLKNSGVITDELYTTLRTKYKNHVPLNRIFAETDDIGSVLSGKGFNVRSTGIKFAKGSEREVDDILNNIITNYEQAVLRSEKNIVDQATLNFARRNEDILGDLFKITRPQAVGIDFGGKMIMAKTTDPTILQMFENGKRVWIKIDDPNLAIALQGVGKEKIGTILKPIATFTRLYSGLATRFNPEFALPNKIRDLQETAVYLASQKGMGFKGATKMVARDVLQQNTKGVLDYIRGANTDGARLYKELKEMGGTTGGFGLSTREQTKLSLKGLESLANSKTRRIADNLVKYIDNWNTIFEDSTRLSVYRQGLKQGLSKERAAFLAKEASINFNRMGRGGPVINALWMFSNASIQGTTKMIMALKNPKVLGATVLAVGGSVSAVNQWNDNIDPEWRDKVTKWDRLNGLPIVLPNKEGEGVKYVTIPVSWGIKPIKVVSDYAYDAISGKGGFNVRDFISNTITAMLEAYNPAGGSDLASALMPTIGDIPLELARNKSWSGSKIRPDFDPNAPADVQYFNSLGETKTGQTAISIAEILQSKTGIAISPADMKYAFDNYIGGVGRSVSKTINTITGAVGGNPAPIDEYPMVSRFYRERTQEELDQGSGGKTKDIKRILEKQSRERFKLKEEAEKVADQLSQLDQNEAAGKFDNIAKTNPDLAKKIAEVVKDKELGLSYTERLIKQLGVENGERAKYIQSEFDKLKTDEEKATLWDSYVEKGIITKEVSTQLSSEDSQPAPTPQKQSLLEPFSPKNVAKAVASVGTVKTAYAAEMNKVGVPEQYQPTFEKAADKHGVPVKILAAIAKHESAGTFQADIKQIGFGLGRGMFQIDLGQHPEITEAQANDPEFAADFAAKLLKEAYDQYGNWETAIKIYNAGSNFNSNRAGYNGKPINQLANEYLQNIQQYL